MSRTTIPPNRFEVPLAPEKSVPRKGVAKKFREGLRGRLIRLTAPPGYGKTTAAILWLKSDHRTAAWITLNSYDDTPSVFYRLFCAALASIKPDCASLQNALQSPSFGASPIEHTIEAVLGMPDIGDDDGACVIVLDDIHLIGHPEIIKSFPLVLKRLPAGYVVLSIGRGKLRGRGRVPASVTQPPEEGVTVLDFDNLKFTKEEVKACFALHGHAIRDGEARSIRKTGKAWPIAISAMASGNLAVGNVVTPEGIVENCIRGQFWEACSEEKRNFLLRTCILNVLVPDICRELSGNPDAERILEEITGESSLLYQNADGSYLRHDLLTEFLRERFQSGDSGGIEISELYEIATKYYLDLGLPYQAVRYAIKSRKKPLIQAVFNGILCYDARNNSVAEHVDKVRMHLIGQIPEEEIEQYPYLRLIFTWYHHLIGDFAAMSASFDALYEALRSKRYDDDPEFLWTANWFLPLDNRLPLESLPERIYKGAKGEAEKYNRPFAPVVAKNLPFFHRGPRDFCRFAGMPEDGTYFRSFFPGQRRDTVHMLELLLRAGIYYEKNMLPEALACAEECERSLTPEAAPDVTFCSAMIKAAILRASDQDAEADAHLNAIEQDLREAGALFLCPNFSAYRVRLRMEEGDATAVDEWMRNYFVDTEAPLETYRVYQHLTTARVLMVQPDLKKARAFLQRLIELTDAFGRFTDKAEALMLMAILEWYRGRRPIALKFLEESLSLVQDLEFIRIFANEGTVIIPTLKSMMVRVSAVGYAGILDMKYLKKIHIAAMDCGRRHDGILKLMNAHPRKLSAQQLLVLSYFAKGYSNQEISDTTGLSKNTVKVHSALVYKKLGVSNATEAVVKANQLGIFDEPPRRVNKLDRRLKSNRVPKAPKEK